MLNLKIYGHNDLRDQRPATAGLTWPAAASWEAKGQFGEAFGGWGYRQVPGFNEPRSIS
jgi:hypothetical protein